MIDGFINVYKEQGYTSFDVVAKLRGILKQKKIGHTGTLDPLAEGVLLVCLGQAAKLCDLLVEKDKEYECVMLLGKTSDTEDISGTILTDSEEIPDETAIREAVESFIGDYDQIPPMYSAIKVNGKKLYELARQGIEIERQPRQVEIYSLDILSIEKERVTFHVSCSKGTYIRSLCRDIGEKLGCGALMEKLVRTGVREFSVSDSLTLKQIEELRDTGCLSEHIVPLDYFLKDMPSFHVRSDKEKLLQNGNKLKPSDFLENQVITDTYVRVYTEQGVFMALYKYKMDRQEYVPYKMLLGEQR